MTYELNETGASSALSSRSKQFIMHYLRKVGRPVSVRSLAEQLAVWEAERRGEGATEFDEREIYSWLVAEQIPKLVEHGLVRYDQQAKTVAPV